MENPKKFTLKLEANEYIATAYARIASGPGWKNRPLWVIVGNSETGKMKETCIQPEEQTAEMRTLYSISAIASAEMTAAVERIAQTQVASRIMQDIIYDDKTSAKAACEEYAKAMYDLQKKLGVWEENDDSCSETRTYARYRNESGKVANYCHS